MARTLLAAVLTLCVASTCFAQEKTEEKKEDKTPKPNASVATKPPPYNPVAERAKFFKAAGKDSELDKTEFAADQAKTNKGTKGCFVRKTDSWANIIKYDKNKSGKIDWFEADAYRRSLGKTKPVTITTVDGRPITTGGGGSGDPRRGGSTRGRRGGGWSPEVVKKYDANNDGQLNDAERRAYYDARRAEYQKRQLAETDTNKDGKIDDEERKVMYEAYRKRRAEETRKRHFERFDANKDGKLEGDEQAAFDKHEGEHKAREERDQARRKEFMKQHDKDGDGTINDKELEGIRAYYRQQSE